MLFYGLPPWCMMRCWWHLLSQKSCWDLGTRGAPDGSRRLQFRKSWSPGNCCGTDPGLDRVWILLWCKSLLIYLTLWFQNSPFWCQMLAKGFCFYRCDSLHAERENCTMLPPFSRWLSALLSCTAPSRRPGEQGGRKHAGLWEAAVMLWWVLVHPELWLLLQLFLKAVLQWSHFWGSKEAMVF